MAYLTAQDLIWINSELAKKPVRFRVMDLEECVGYQYVYGSRPEPIPQAARFLEGILTRKPFEECNRLTALIAVLCFLRRSGLGVLQDKERASDLLQRVEGGQISALEAVRGFITGPADEPAPPLEQLFRALASVYA